MTVHTNTKYSNTCHMICLTGYIKIILLSKTVEQ